MHWLWLQLILTWDEIKATITIPHIITGIVSYIIVHTASKKGVERGAQNVENAAKKYMRQIINKHVWDRHGGHPLKCEQSECRDALTVVTDPLPR